MSTRGSKRKMSNHQRHRTYAHNKEERKSEMLYSDSEYGNTVDNQNYQSLKKKQNNFEDLSSDSNVKLLSDTKKVIKRGDSKLSNRSDADGVRFIKKHWNELK